MPEHYDADNSNSSPPVAEKKKREGKKLSDKQKTDLNKHMGKMKKDGMSLTEQRSHRMRLMSRMRKDENVTAKKAHKEIMGSK